MAELTDAQRIEKLERQVAGLLEHARPLLNTRNKLLYAGVNEIDLRPYGERRLVTDRKFGVKVYALTDEPDVAELKLNAARLKRALSSKIPLELPKTSGRILIHGPVEVTTAYLDLLGYGRTCPIVQMDSSDTLIVHKPALAQTTHVHLYNVCFTPGIANAEGVACRIEGPAGSNPGVLLNGCIADQNITGDTDEEKFQFGGGGFHVHNPGRALFFDCHYKGINNQSGIPFKLTNSIISVQATFDHCYVDGALRGLVVESTGQPGIEGTRVLDCDFVACEIGVEATCEYDPEAYNPPQFDIVGCHMNCSYKCVQIEGFSQSRIEGCIFYQYNNPAQGGYAVDLLAVQNFNVKDNQFFAIGGGPTYGVLINSGCRDVVVDNNQGRLTVPSEAREEAFIINYAGTQDIKVTNNRAKYAQRCFYDLTGEAVAYENYNQYGLEGGYVLEDEIIRPGFQTVFSESGTWYYKITEFQSEPDSGGNIAVGHLSAHLGDWTGDKRQSLDLRIYDRLGTGEASGLIRQHSGSYGRRPDSGIVACQHTETRFVQGEEVELYLTSLWLVLDGAFQRATVGILSSWLLDRMPQRLANTKTSSLPAGADIVYDSRDWDNFPPAFHADPQTGFHSLVGKFSAVPGTADIPQGFMVPARVDDNRYGLFVNRDDETVFDLFGQKRIENADDTTLEPGCYVLVQSIYAGIAIWNLEVFRPHKPHEELIWQRATAINTNITVLRYSDSNGATWTPWRRMGSEILTNTDMVQDNTFAVYNDGSKLSIRGKRGSTAVGFPLEFSLSSTSPGSLSADHTQFLFFSDQTNEYYLYDLGRLHNAMIQLNNLYGADLPWKSWLVPYNSLADLKTALDAL